MNGSSASNEYGRGGSSNAMRSLYTYLDLKSTYGVGVIGAGFSIVYGATSDLKSTKSKIVKSKLLLMGIYKICPPFLIIISPGNSIAPFL
jgi:hypothetical protein